MKTSLFFISACLLQCFVSAQEQEISHEGDLEPVASALTYHSPEYQLALRKVLFDKAPKRCIAQLLVLPSFRPEFLVSVYQIPGGFEVQVIRPEKDIWGEGEQEGVDPLTTDKGVQIVVVGPDQQTRWEERKLNEIECEIAHKKLPDSFAIRIKTVWRSMLRRTRYQPSDVQIIDGVEYVFMSFERGVGWWSGKTHSPREGTRSSVMVEVGEALVGFVEGEPGTEEDTLTRMTQLMDRLELMLRPSGTSEVRKQSEEGTGRAPA